MPWLGIAEFEAGLQRVARQADDASKLIVAKSAAVLIKEAQSDFSGTRKWVSGDRGGRHLDPPAHTGGDQPNVISGDLRRSIKAEPIVRLGLATYGTSVGPKVAYGRRVELGYLGSHGYPFFDPAVERARLVFAEIARTEWAKFV